MKVLELEELNFGHRHVIYTALLKMVKRNDGTGFHNSDQGHPAYRIGCDNKWDYDAWGDSPEHNELYQAMRILASSLSDCPDFAPSDLVTDWSSFCRMATEAYTKHNGG